MPFGACDVYSKYKGKCNNKIEWVGGRKVRVREGMRGRRGRKGSRGDKMEEGGGVGRGGR